MTAIPEYLARAMWVVAALACVGTAMASLARVGWLCELASHFRAQYACVLVVSAAVLLGARRPWEAVVASGCGLVNLSLLAPFYVRTNTPSSRRQFCALSANVLSSNTSYERLRQLLQRVQPDVAVLLEVTPVWLASLRDVLSAYPFTRSIVLRFGFGIVLLSRLPFESSEVVGVGEVELPVVMARLRADGQCLTVIGVHPLAPMTPFRARLRNRQLAALAEYVRRQPGPVMVLGDLNTTSWSPVFHDFMRTTQLRDSRQGFGLQPTWPVHVAIARIPIDHCLVSRDVAVHERRIGPSVGSDHYPVIVDFSLAPSSDAAVGRPGQEHHAVS